MKEEIKQFLKENWKTAASIIGAAILLAISYFVESCGSTWKISGNTVNVNNKCKNDWFKRWFRLVILMDGIVHLTQF